MMMGCGPSGGSFVGPLDGLPAPLAAYSFRRLLSAYIANKAVNIRRSSDNAAQDFGFLASGSFDAASAAAFIGAGSGFITKWYDQSGNGYDVAQGTAANQPGYSASGLNSLPTGNYVSSSSQILIRSTSPSQAAPLTIMVIAKRSGLNFMSLLGTNGGAPLLGFTNSSGGVRAIFTSTVSTSGATEGFAHCIGAAINGASSKWFIDGSASAFSSNPGVGTITGMALGGSPTFGNYLNGPMPEALLFGGALADADAQTIQANQKTYYGTP